MADSNSLETLRTGVSMAKLKRNGKLYRRKYKLQEDSLLIQQMDTKKKKWLRRATCRHMDVLKVPLYDIDTIREGPRSDNFIKYFHKLQVHDDQCLSVVYGNKKCLDLVLDNETERNRWLAGLKYLQKNSEENELNEEQETWMKQLFHKADKNDDGVLSFKEVKCLLASMNMEADSQTVKAIYNMADAKDGWSMKDFIGFCRLLTDRQEVKDIFNKYSYDSKYLDACQLQNFCKNEQCTDLAEAECETLIKTYEKCSCVKSRHKMSYYAFHAMMEAPIMNIFNQKHETIYQDMRRPLAHYWIDSSHNTYLMADQLKGASAVEAYIRALLRGCRCVELDCWDGKNGEPIIYHGYTMTSKILFKDAIEGIKQYAFKESPYPVILSIENHCSLEQQHKMGDYMKEIFGDMLFTTQLPDIEELPSPEALKGKILIKAKKLPDDIDGDGEISEEDEAAETAIDEVQEKVEKKKKKTIELCRELSNLVTVCQSVKFKGFDHAASNYNCKQLSSFSENKAGKLFDKSPREYIVHNQTQVSRIYPAGSRVNSSNYNPVNFWNTGCQIVALNYQTDDEPMMINQGRFQDNGWCGYVLKPDILLSKEINFDPSLPASHQPLEWRKTLQIKVISGYQLPQPKKTMSQNIIDPYVQVEIQGIEADNQKQQTDHLHNNGFNPVWNHTMTFNVTVPQLALVFFKLWDDDLGSDDIVAQYCLPFGCIRQGYRTIHLNTTHGDHIHGATLFVHVAIK